MDDVGGMRLIKKTEGEVLLGLLLFFFLYTFFTELEHHLAGIGRPFRIQAIITTSASRLNDGLCRLAVAQQILLDIRTDFLIVRLEEEGTVHVVNMLGNRLYAYTTLPCLGEYFQYLLIVSQKK